MARRLFLFVAAVFSCCAKLLNEEGESSENSTPKIFASAGDPVILPCQTNIRDKLLTVEWRKMESTRGIIALGVEWRKMESTRGKIALVYRDERENYDDNDEAFINRTNFVKNKPIDGNFSMTIFNVQLSDEGIYICKTIFEGHKTEAGKLELVVGAVSEPNLSFVKAVDGEVTLQCEAICWFPEPDISFLDNQGSEIKAHDSKTSRPTEPSGCVTVTRRVTLQTATDRVTCKVHQRKINQTRFTEIYIPENCTRSCTKSIIMAVVATIIVCGFVLCWYGKCPIHKVPWKSSEKSEIISNPETYSPRNQTDVIKKDIIEHLRKLDPLDKEAIFPQIYEELKCLRPDLVPGFVQLDHFPNDNSPKPSPSTNSTRPKSDSLPQNNNSNPSVSIQIPPQQSQIKSSIHHSSPALFRELSPTSSHAATKDQGDVVRTMSMSQSTLRPKNPILKRRATYSALSNNRFSVLQGLSEDSDQLLP